MRRALLLATWALAPLAAVGAGAQTPSAPTIASASEPAPAAAPDSAGPHAALLRAVALDEGELEIERLRFLAWLADSASVLPAAARERASEHLHYLVTSSVRARLGAGEPPWPAGGDEALARLFAWQARLGALGAGLVARALDPRLAVADSSGGGEEAPVLLPASPLVLTLEGGEYLLRSSGVGWSLRAPYYFSIETASTGRASNGVLTEKLVVATPFGAHADESGESRGTVLVVAARTRDRAAFRDFWRLTLGAADSTRAPGTPLRGATAYLVRDARWRTVTEVVALDVPGGAMVVAYAAAEGAYESQRPAFVELLRRLQLPGAGGR